MISDIELSVAYQRLTLVRLILILFLFFFFFFLVESDNKMITKYCRRRGEKEKSDKFL